MKRVVGFFPALKVIVTKEELKLTCKGKKNEFLSLRKINLFPPLIYNGSYEFAAPIDSELPHRKKTSWFYPFQNPVSLQCQDDRYGICHPLVPG